MNEEKEKEDLFLKGLEAYHDGNYFDAHEFWEDLWSDYYLEDRRFIQGLIQLSVSFFHLENGNLKGANSLMRKCQEKFIDYSGVHRNIDVDSLKQKLKIIQEEYKIIKDTTVFNYELIPDLI
ncbi:MAG: DUF309 domain-containing protein [Candidatus Marinimicrobia bacterium]|nr:DUF309 domain-containing protein [Candidatus Neomarinimicrobiota bacterium]